MQRLVAGGTLVYYGLLALAQAPHSKLAVPQILGAAAGVLILAGLWTPVAGLVASGAELWIASAQPPDMWMAIVLAVLCVSLAMIGPGALSLDARLFGRKQIDVDLPKGAS